MKIRNGFVSNSSSSSFIILSKDNLEPEKLIEIFDIKESSPIYEVIKRLASNIINCSTEMTPISFLNEYTCKYTSNGNDKSTEEKETELKEDYPEYYEYYMIAKEKNWKIYDGSADSYEDSDVASLDISYNNDDIIIEMNSEY